MGIARRPKGARGTGGRPEKATFDAVKKKEIGVSDLTLLSKISNEAINDNLKKRFEGKEIYTYIGHVLVSVNPFRDLGIYTDEVLDSYKGKNRLDMPPHVYAIAESAYFNLKAYKHNQCVIISGESGAGKTEAAKRIMQYIANVSVHKDDRTAENARATKIKDMVLATNPLLESFGNAKTLRNNNSSRFGKYLQIHFDKGTGAPVGADITNYLLEKSRVVGQIVNERNFHIFYQFTKGASQQYRETFGIQGPETYAYLARSKCFDVDGINDISDFKDTLEAMNIIGLTQEEQDEIFRMLAAILWVGNIQFTEDESGYAAVTTDAQKSVIAYAAYLLQVSDDQLLDAITIRILTPRSGEVIESPTNPAQATATRDALAKAIYSNLFDWIVARINNSLNLGKEEESLSIGILDIYGFEIFEKNSFEQLCINYVNEKLQQIFIQLTLKAEQEEYAREQIQWTPIKFFDNKVVCDLIEQIRPPGIFSAMKDATKTAHADPAACDRTFMQSINGMSHGHLTPRQGNFIIKHYAGDVAYQVDGITDKNKDQLLKGLLNLFQWSKRGFVHTLFPQQVDQDNRRQPPSAGDRIRESANLLVDTLMKCSPSYIRTIKPNENKSPTEYNGPNVLHQIKYLGLQENVRIRRAGFAARQEFETFRRRFFHLSPRISYAAFYTYHGTEKDATRMILEDTKIPPEEWQMGVTKVFIKSPETLFALETMREKWHENMMIKIQRWWRKHLAPMQLMKIRDKGHELLGGRKERRSMSLLGSRRFLGDYLGIDATTGPGAKIRSAANIGSSERTVFSCHGEILETKFGRSSKTSPRTIVVTNRNFYIVAQMLVNGQHQITTEKSIPLGAIKFIGTSSCQDDWFSLGIGSPQEGDPLMNCIFKTEMFTQMQEVMPGGLNLKIGDSIEYAKKPNKMQMVKVLKDSQMREDYYKSGAIHTKQGNPANSKSKPTPRSKSGSSQPSARSQRLVRLMPDESDSTSTHVASNAASHAQNAANAYTSPKASTHVASNATSHAQNATNAYSSPKMATHVATNAASHARNTSGATRRPPPPPTPPTLSKIWAKATWAYPQPGTEAGAGCLTIAADEEIEILDKSEQGGWWKAKNKAGEIGFVPKSYVEELLTPPKSKAPVVPNKKVDIQQKRDSGMGLNGTNGSDSSRSNTPTPNPSAERIYNALMANHRAK